MSQNSRGGSLLPYIVVALIIAGGIGWYLYNGNQTPDTANPPAASEPASPPS